jgi:hypothetical protein
MPYTGNNMDHQSPNTEPTQPSADSPAMQNRRDLVSKLGKYAIYAAPFTVMALNNKAIAASGNGPGPSPSSRRGAGR